MDRARLAARGKTGVLRIGSIAVNLHDFRRVVRRVRARIILSARCSSGTSTSAIPSVGCAPGTSTCRSSGCPSGSRTSPSGRSIYTEPIVLAVGVTHRLAGRDSVSYEDLADETVMGGARPDYWREILVPLRTPSGQSDPDRPVGRQLPGDDPDPRHWRSRLARARPGRPLLRAAGHRLRAHPGRPAGRLGLIWRTGSETELIRSFASVAHHLTPSSSPTGSPWHGTNAAERA